MPVYTETLIDYLEIVDWFSTPSRCDDYLNLQDQMLFQVTNFSPIFGSVAGADRYFATVLHGQLWECTPFDQKMKALVTATNAINLLRFAGEKSYPHQILEWPRNHKPIPLELLQATYEEALALLKGIDPVTEASNLYVKSRVFGRLQRVQTDYDFSLHAPEHVVAGIASFRAWQLLKPLLSPAKGVRLRRRS